MATNQPGKSSKTYKTSDTTESPNNAAATSESGIQWIPVLVESENARNVGFVARAMKCSGLRELRVVHSQWNEIPPGAYITGTSAVRELYSAKIFKSVEEALADCDAAIALSRRNISRIPGFELQELEENIPPGKKIALVFGRESAGLRQEEVALCQCICSIDTYENMSYNLGQAAAMVFYQVAALQKGPGYGNRREVDNTEAGPPASMAEKAAFKDFVLEHLSEKALKNQTTPLVVDRMLREWNPESTILRAFFGICRDMVGPPKPRQKQ